MNISMAVTLAKDSTLGPGSQGGIIAAEAVVSNLDHKFEGSRITIESLVFIFFWKKKKTTTLDHCQACQETVLSFKNA